MTETSQSLTYLKGKNVLIGVTGSIAAYKSAELVRQLKKAQVNVRVAMTENAKRFITPLTLQALSGFPVHDDLFDLEAEAAMGHIELARWADIILVAPASADFMVRLKDGHADDLLSTICLAAKAPVAIAPAMNQVMWHQEATQATVKALTERGFLIIGPALGSQACGEYGPGRMVEADEIVHEVDRFFRSGLLSGVTVLITAGPTHEAFDPIRYITNKSSGKMGYALAEAAKAAGANVILISGPVSLSAPERITIEHVISAREMHDCVMKHLKESDIFIGVAAVSDYRPEKVAPQKLHKGEDTLTLHLVKNPDIISEVAKSDHRPYVVGFAAETENVLAQGKKKLKMKQLDMIIINDVSSDKGMHADSNEVMVCYREHESFFPLESKTKLSKALIELIANDYHQIRQKND